MMKLRIRKFRAAFFGVIVLAFIAELIFGRPDGDLYWPTTFDLGTATLSQVNLACLRVLRGQQAYSTNKPPVMTWISEENDSTITGRLKTIKYREYEVKFRMRHRPEGYRMVVSNSERNSISARAEISIWAEGIMNELASR
jgi:hypothetical protein